MTTVKNDNTTTSALCAEHDATRPGKGVHLHAVETPREAHMPAANTSEQMVDFYARLMAGIANMEQFALLYVDNNGRETERVIVPLYAYTLITRGKNRQNLQYIYAACLTTGNFRHFAVANMEECEPAGEVWTPKVRDNGSEIEVHLLYPAINRLAGNDVMIIEEYDPGDEGLTVEDLVKSGRWAYEPKELVRFVRRQLVA